LKSHFIISIVSAESKCWSDRLGSASDHCLVFFLTIGRWWLLFSKIHFFIILILMINGWITKDFLTLLIKWIIKILNIRFLFLSIKISLDFKKWRRCMTSLHKPLFRQTIMLLWISCILNGLIHQLTKYRRHSMQYILGMNRIWFHDRVSVCGVVDVLQQLIVGY
jgi:hypothetical protein